MLSNSKKENIDRVTSGDFIKSYYAKSVPTILTDVVPKWKAYQSWDPEYYVEKLGGKPVEVAVSDESHFSYTSDTVQYRHEKMLLNQAMEKIQSAGNNGSFYYIMQKLMSEDFPELLPDIEIPSWLDPDEISTNLWVGSANNFTPLHYEHLENFLAQVYGSKHFTLYSPNQLELLYPKPLSNNHPHVSSVDIMNPDYSKYPKFADAEPIEFTLHPGEMLYLPSHWWHAVKSLSTSMMVNFWGYTENLEVYLSEPTGIRSLWMIYKSDLLQSLSALIDKNEMTYISCAKRVLPVSPSASILLAHAGIINAVLRLKVKGNTAKIPVEEFSEHFANLLSEDVLSNEDLDVIQTWRYLVLETFTGVEFDIERASEMISNAKIYIAGITNE
ncbi:MAG: cupin-like domain-containing protein [Alteromonadaceae bacterium]|nr:cupin-like domain-containing protein [Alteromonadaceae bacterium]